MKKWYVELVCLAIKRWCVRFSSVILILKYIPLSLRCWIRASFAESPRFCSLLKEAFKLYISYGWSGVVVISRRSIYSTCLCCVEI
ncbi:hypothetical protein FRX31_019893 [Thalictrum thalictroides]|uniref:Uncharacterized protein n=1 Tax=Thalictrum thalictroides TaxID=46969 RepID=A0A7J6W050_THATH|nr:hypothetical protein FRX31_019893 [Thalictrum thalictroides]